MKRWIVITGTIGGNISCSFENEDCEGLATYDRLEEAMAEKAVIKRKWSYLHVWVIELDFADQEPKEFPWKHDGFPAQLGEAEGRQPMKTTQSAPDVAQRIPEHVLKRLMAKVRKLRLEYLRGELRAERISLDELNELASLAPYIEPGDVELLEAAGVPEFPENQ